MPPRRDRIERIFEHLVSGRLDEFFEHLDENVRWTVMGSHILAGTYHGRRGLRESRFLPILRDLAGGADAAVRAIHITEDLAVVELETTPRWRSDNPCRMAYCWIVRFDDQRIREVRAYPDPAIINHLMHSRG